MQRTKAKSHAKSLNNIRSASLTSEPDLAGVVSVVDDDEKALIRNTWKVLAVDLTGIGKQVFLKIFEMQPSVKQLFPFRHVWGDSLIGHPQFQAHVVRFMLAVGQAVEHMDDLSAIGRSLYQLGKGHTQHKGFTVGYFDAFLASMLFVWQQELKMSTETAEAWRKLMEFVLDRLKTGYNDQLKMEDHINRQNCNLPSTRQ